MSRAFLKPRSVIDPPQGDYLYIPVVDLFEADTLAGLQAQLTVEFATSALSTTEFWVVEDVDYEITTTWPNQNNPVVIYSALVRYTKVQKI